MDHSSLSRRAPKGISFSIGDHVRARQWANAHNLQIVVDLEYGLADEEYEEVLALYKVQQTSRLFCVIWRELRSVVVQPVVGRAIRYTSLSSALHALQRAALKSA